MHRLTTNPHGRTPLPGNNESVEPFTSNMYSRRVLAGEFTVVNKYLLRDLIDRGLWTQDVRNQIMHDRGSVQNVTGMPQDLKVGTRGRGGMGCWGVGWVWSVVVVWIALALP